MKRQVLYVVNKCSPSDFSDLPSVFLSSEQHRPPVITDLVFVCLLLVL